MLAYLVRRLLYAIPILVGVNLIIFGLFFFVNSPDDMARTVLGDKRVTQEQIDDWKRQKGYDVPAVINWKARGFDKITETVFWRKAVPLFMFDFGRSDEKDVLIGAEVRKRIGPSLRITVPTFIVSLVVNVFLAMIVAFYRGTYIDFAGLILCVLLMSISVMFYIIGGQFLMGTYLRLFPVSGFDPGFATGLKFLLLPVIIGIIGGIGGGVRYNRTLFLEEINKDYVRTARAKGLGEGKVLFKHALKNAMIPMLTSIVISIPFLIMGSMLLENFFGIPGLGRYTIEAIIKQDFAVVRAMVYLGSVLYVASLIMVDISYTLVDPRIRLG